MSAFVDRFANPDDAWSVRLSGGMAYRINLVSSGGRCAVVEFHAPDGEIARRLRCDAHTVFVPPSSGVHTLHVKAPRASRERIRYRLRAGAATADDSAPGIPLANDVAVRGALHGSELDAVDMYRFTIARRSRVQLTLRTGADFELRLLEDDGSRLASGGTATGAAPGPGRYFVVVAARDGAGGRYTLRRLARTITSSQTAGERRPVRDRGSGQLRAASSSSSHRPWPGAPRLMVERFDPLAGWLFHATYRPAVSAGRAALSFQPSGVGRWRATGEFTGTRTAAPSEGGTVRFNVEEPLEE